MDKKQEVLPQKRYERSLNHNYMILSSYSFFEEEREEGYMTRMLFRNKISGLLPMICRKNMGETQYCYEINSLQSLDRLYEKQDMSYEDLSKLLLGCIRIFERLEEYLIDGSQILLQPEYIYLHMETKEPYFVCYPDYDGDVRCSFQKLMDYLLTKIDHTQEQAVWFSYQVYRYTRNPNYVLSEIKSIFYEAEEKVGASEEKNDCSEIEEEEHLYEQESEEEGESGYKEESLYGRNKNLFGVLLCVLLVFSAAGIIFGAKLLKLISLSQKQEISLYGAIGMAMVAGALFFVSIVKKWKQEEQLRELSMKEEDEITYWKNSSMPNISADADKNKKSLSITEQQTSKLSGATTVLSQELIQERMLRGTVNGEELCIPLKNFPLTIGKLAEVCDYVIPDNTVSRMHIRLEQRNGQIYIFDLNSTNGTIRNGHMLGIQEEVAIEPGDELMLGRVCFTYC